MQAIILAAGMGKRLHELTKDNTKCMVSVDGVTLIDRLLHQLERKHLSRIVVVIGYKGKELSEHIGGMDIKTPVVFVENPVYDKTNNIYSLGLAKDHLAAEDTLLFESDLIFEDKILDMLVSDPRDTLAVVDTLKPWMDGTCVKLSGNDFIEAFVPRKQLSPKEASQWYKTVNIYKFSRDFSKNQYIPFLEAYQKAFGVTEYYEQVLKVVSMLDHSAIRALRLGGELWYEIDDRQDLDIAQSLFAKNAEKRLALIKSRFGGYWRYPELLDFCYPVNPYFPPAELSNEMQTSFRELLTRYPSGADVNALLAGKLLGVKQDCIIAGNGSSELIKALLSGFSGKTGIVRPTFEEYPNRLKDTVCFETKAPDFSYEAEDLISFFTANPVRNLIVVNPDNPTGNYIPKKKLMKLCDFAQTHGINLVIDESFADFAEEPCNSMLSQDILDKYPNLFVIKSIAKSYGVPGLRLGAAASGNTEKITQLKKDIPIWNINSFAEYFMQILEKYRGDYQAAIRRFREERKRFLSELAKINGIRVLPTQANFVMAELTENVKASELAQRLLCEYNILIKDLTEKAGASYIRIAIKATEDNERCLAALKSILGRTRTE